MNEDIIKVRVQNMFPNCEKYNKDCGKHSTGKCNIVVPALAFGQPIPLPTTTKLTTGNRLKKPEGFNGW